MLVNENNDDSASIDIRGGNDIGETKKWQGLKKTVMLKDTESNIVAHYFFLIQSSRFQIFKQIVNKKKSFLKLLQI